MNCFTNTGPAAVVIPEPIAEVVQGKKPNGTQYLLATLTPGVRDERYKIYFQCTQPR